MPYRLKLDCPPGREVRRVIAELIARALRCVEDPHPPLAQRVHFARTSCKKIRAALRLIRSSEPKTWRRENAWFRDTARALAELRDTTVLPQTLRTLLTASRQGASGHEGTAVQRALLAQRRRAVADAANTKDLVEDVTARFRAAERRLATWTPALAAKDAVDEFRRSYRQARDALRAAESCATSDTLHAYRKRAKTHGYHCRLLRCAWPTVMRARQHELDELSELLGEEHDLVVLADWLKAHAATGKARLPQRQLQRMIRTRRAALCERSFLLGARLFTDKPSIVAQRMLAWWHTAHALARLDNRSLSKTK